MGDHFAINLKLACSHYRSISEVCRQLSINRAQFNKYLSGQSRPTAYNLKRIGDFFGVEEYELGLPPEQFARLIGARNLSAESGPQNDPISELFAAACPCGQSVALLRLLLRIFQLHVGPRLDSGVAGAPVGGARQLSVRAPERQERSSATDLHAEVRCRYLGAAFQLQDRVFLIDYESLTLNEMSQTVLIPSFKSRITRLNGLKTGVSSGDRRNPACTRVVWEYRARRSTASTPTAR